MLFRSVPIGGGLQKRVLLGDVASQLVSGENSSDAWERFQRLPQRRRAVGDVFKGVHGAVREIEVAVQEAIHPPAVAEKRRESSLSGIRYRPRLEAAGIDADTSGSFRGWRKAMVGRKGDGVLAAAEPTVESVKQTSDRAIKANQDVLHFMTVRSVDVADEIERTRRLLITGDLLFVFGTPIVWAGPYAGWTRACDLLLSLDCDVYVPGHGPLTDRRGVEGIKAYLEFVHTEARARFDAGMTARDAAFDIDLGPYAEWGDSERLAINVVSAYREFDPSLAMPDFTELFGLMARLAARNGA